MKRLFLSSSFADVSDKFPKFINTNIKNKSVAFIPTACIPEEVKTYMDNDRKAFEQLGITINELEISLMAKDEIKKILTNSDFIFIGGGNTFFLLEKMIESGAFQLIREEILHGKPYIGTSAGSVILSPNIMYIEGSDDSSVAKSLKDFSGMNVIDFFPLPHYKSEPFEKIMDKVYNDYKDQLNIIPISNQQVIEVENDKVNVI